MQVFVVNHDGGVERVFEGTIRDDAQLSVPYDCPPDRCEDVRLLIDGRVLSYRVTSIYLTQEEAQARAIYSRRYDSDL